MAAVHVPFPALMECALCSATAEFHKSEVGVYHPTGRFWTLYDADAAAPAFEQFPELEERHRAALARAPFAGPP